MRNECYNSLKYFKTPKALKGLSCILIFLSCLCISSCKQPSAKTASNAALKFEMQSHNFGVLKFEVPGCVAFNHEGHEEHEVLHEGNISGELKTTKPNL